MLKVICQTSDQSGKCVMQRIIVSEWGKWVKNVKLHCSAKATFPIQPNSSFVPLCFNFIASFELFQRVFPSVVRGNVRGLLKMHEACNNSVEYLTNLNNIDVYQAPSGIYKGIYYSQTSPSPSVFKTTNAWKRNEGRTSLNVFEKFDGVPNILFKLVRKIVFRRCETSFCCISMVKYSNFNG